MTEQRATDGTENGSGRSGRRPRLRSAALVVSGFVAGGILVGTVTAAVADDDRGGWSSEDGRGGHGDRPGRGGGPGAGEEALTGDTADQVEEAVLAEYPDAEIERLETDADGVYEAHIVTADGEELTVELDEEFAVTGTDDR